MNRCFNCGNLLAENNRDVCIKCLNKVLQDKNNKSVVVTSHRTTLRSAGTPLESNLK